MPQISSFYGILIFVYYNDHNPPHFHAEYNEFEMLVTISDLSIYKGSLPPKAFALVMEWAIQYKEELQNAWNMASSGIKPGKISPLL